jgi:hypothetical protein
MIKTLLNIIGRIETEPKYIQPDENSHWMERFGKKENKSQKIDKFLKDNKLN